MSYQVDSYGNAYFPAGVSVASIPATTGTQNKVLVPGVNGRISSATVAQLITQSGSNLVTSVYGRTGAVTAALGDYNTDLVTEGQALYFSTSRARKSIFLTTFNTSGPATYDSNTGILNIPQYGSASNGNFVPLTRKISINGQTADLSVDRMFSVEEMVYPPIGIPLSNGTSWGASITNNSTNWNTAYSWGNHAGLYSLLGHTHTFASLTSIPTTLAGYGITDAATSATPAPSISYPAKKSSTMVSGLSIKGAKLSWPGLDSEGLPTALSVSGKNGEIGKIRVNKNVPVATEAGTVLSTQAITAAGGPNVMLLQTITVDGNGTSYKLVGASYGKDGFWASLEEGATSADFERLSNGQYLVTVRISLVSTLPLGYVAPVGTRGYDLTATPKSITTRLLLNAGKTQILAQSIYVDESNAGKA